MKKTYILLIFLLFFSTVMLVNTKNVYADGPTTFDITFTSNKPNFNTINNTLTFDYSELGSSNPYVSVTAEISNHETNEFDFEWKNVKQYLIGFGIALVLAIFIGLIPAACGSSISGAHQDFKIGDFFFRLF